MKRCAWPWLLGLALALACSDPHANEEEGQGPSEQELQAAVDAYCETQSRCLEEAGVGPPDHDCHAPIEQELQSHSPSCRWYGIAYYECFAEVECRDFLVLSSSRCVAEAESYFDSAQCRDSWEDLSRRRDISPRVGQELEAATSG